jgi:hypothetical protein
VINIRFPKTLQGKKGDFVDIFPFSGCCPLEGLKSLAKNKPSFVAKNLPVFTFDNGKHLTNDQFTNTVKALLKKSHWRKCKFYHWSFFSGWHPCSPF